jgi:hypothetical protein
MSTRPIQEPEVTEETGPGGLKQTVSRHPAFGQIGASRVSGSRALYASDFRHNAFMTIRIARSELRRDLSRDWHFARDELIEVALTEAQWATFVSAPNIGSGVPCTIQHIDRAMVPGLPDPASRVDQFRSEMEAKLAKGIDGLKAMLAEIDGLGLPKGKAAYLKGGIEALLRDLSSNLPFVASQFSEHMEETVEKAKAEVHGYMTQALQRAGLEALGGSLPLRIEGRTEGGDE